jgi:hypothetical protein
MTRQVRHLGRMCAEGVSNHFPLAKLILNYRYTRFVSHPVLFTGIVKHRFYWVTLGSLSQFFLPWRNPWNNFQVSENPCIKIIISIAHGTLAWSVSCRYNNLIIIDNAVLSRELYCFLWICLFWLTIKKTMFFFSITISRGTSNDISRNPGWETLT